MNKQKVSAISANERQRSAFVAWVRERSRAKRAALFRSTFDLSERTRILDLGGWNGSHIHSVLEGSAVRPKNVHVADISSEAVVSAKTHFGYHGIVLNEGKSLPLDNASFDIVFCSSVLEHVTIAKSAVWSTTGSTVFHEQAVASQAAFAAEIRRVGRAYFVQVPYRWFPVETHTWLPFVGYLPRPAFVRTVRITNRFWIKKTNPDFHLPSRHEMQAHFPDAQVHAERVLGLTKSLIAIKR